MQNITIDWETYYDKDYSIKKLSPLLYIRDPRFKEHGAALKLDDHPAEWVPWPLLKSILSDLDLKNSRVISHNANFDMTILFEKHGIRPGQYVDTLGLCRALLPRGLDLSLGAISPLLGVGEKGTELELSKGMRDLTPEVEEQIARYAENDANLAYGIFQKLWPHFPEMEREVMDLVIEMSTNGVLRWNADVAAAARQKIIDLRDKRLAKVRATETQLRSRDQFAYLLRQKGVEPPTKLNKNGQETYAFSLQDPAFVSMRADPNLADLINARLAATSNSALSRIDRLTAIASHPPYTLPVQLNYHGAHTGRLSGGGGINMQNLQARGDNAGLRLALEAPPDHVIVVLDLNAIELRLNMWFCGEYEILDKLARGEDIYIEEAARQLKIPPESIDKNTPEGKKQRGYGKAVRLGAQYQMGGPRFRDYCAAGPLGIDPIYLTEAESAAAIQTYRQGVPRVVETWQWLQNVAIPAMYGHIPVERGPVRFEHETIVLPGGLTLQYPDLRIDETGNWACGLGGTNYKVYAGITLENIIQALAGVVLKEKMLAVRKAITPLGGRVVHQVHDELLSICHKDVAEQVLTAKHTVMTTPVAWAPDLPLAAEGGYAHNYSK